jgi:hypothetical protein
MNRYLRFSLRTLFVLVTASALASPPAIKAYRAWQERREAERLAALDSERQLFFCGGVIREEMTEQVTDPAPTDSDREAIAPAPATP